MDRKYNLETEQWEDGSNMTADEIEDVERKSFKDAKRIEVRFHKGEPPYFIPTSKLQIRTRRNLQKLEQQFGMKFEDKALVWKVWQPGFAHIGVRSRWAKDICIRGLFREKPVEYWRHETKGYASGQTLIYIAGVRFQVTHLLEEYSNAEVLSQRLRR